MTQAAWPVFAGIDFARGRLFDTTDADEARSVCARVFNPHSLRVLRPSRRLQASMDHLRLGPMSLNRLGWGAAVAVDPDRLADYYLLSVPVRGQARFELDGRAVEVTVARPALVNAAQRFRFTTSDDFDQIVLRVERQAVETAWQALTGAPVTRPIDFAPSVPVEGPAWRALEPVLALAAQQARGAFPALSSQHLGARLQAMLLDVLLLRQPHALSGPLPDAPRAAAAQLRRAECWMHERMAESLTLSDVALACGTSTRTLQAAFHDEYGMGPMQWLRRERLRAARAALLTGRPGDTVSGIALRHGFGHLGEFALAYRRAFGETPRDSLRRAG